MKSKTTAYRVLLRTGQLETDFPPIFKFKWGKQHEHILRPYVVPNPGKLHLYNTQFILEKTTETEITIQCLNKDKLYGTTKFPIDDKKELEHKLEFKDTKTKKVCTLELSIKKLDKKLPLFTFKMQLVSASLNHAADTPGAGPFLIAKIGESNFKTKTLEGVGKNPKWSQLFEVKSQGQENMYIETWYEEGKNHIYLGLATININTNMNTKNNYELVGLKQEKAGSVIVRLYEVGRQVPEEKDIEINDKNIIPAKLLKLYVLEALLKADTSHGKDTYVKIEADGVKPLSTTPIFSQGKNPKWNQTCQLTITDQRTVKVMLCEKDENGVEHILATTTIDTTKLEAKKYELTLKDPGDGNSEVGKLYIEAEGEWLQSPSSSKSTKQEEQNQKELVAADKIQDTTNNNKKPMENKDLQKRIAQMKSRYSKGITTHEYFNKQLHDVLQEGLLKISRDKPADPIRQLGEFLINYRRK